MNLSRLLLALLAVLALTPVAAPQKKPDEQGSMNRTATVEKEILRLEEEGRQKALRGEANWDDLIADGAFMIGFDGSANHYQKGQAFPSFPMKGFKLSELVVRVYGDAAVVTGLGEVEAETPQKQLFSFQQRYINVWQKFGDTWKIAVSERTPVRPPPKN
jgi:ketosteroid isomerase-like protein